MWFDTVFSRPSSKRVNPCFCGFFRCFSEAFNGCVCRQGNQRGLAVWDAPILVSVPACSLVRLERWRKATSMSRIVSDLPSAAVNPEHHRQRFLRWLFGRVDIEDMPRVTVLHIRNVGRQFLGESGATKKQQQRNQTGKQARVHGVDSVGKFCVTTAALLMREYGLCRPECSRARTV